MMTATPTTTPSSTIPSVADDPRWARIVARDETADGHLWYSVSTTGVYCRPSCPSRIANPKNVQLHASLESARAQSFRPCKRCKPDEPSIDVGGAKEEIRFAVGETLSRRHPRRLQQKGVASILLGDDPDELVRNLQDRFPKAHLIGADRDYETLVARVVGFIEAPGIGLDLPLDVRGTTSSNACGRRCGRFPPARRSATLKSPVASAPRRRHARSPVRARPTTWPSPFPATAWSATTARSRDMPGASSARALCSLARRRSADDVYAGLR